MKKYNEWMERALELQEEVDYLYKERKILLWLILLLSVSSSIIILIILLGG